MLSACRDVSVQLLSVEWASSRVGPSICPSQICCTHILGLQVAVAVGLEGDQLGKKVLGLLVSVSVVSASGTSRVAGAIGVTGTFFSFIPQTSDEVTVGPSVVVSLLFSCTAAKTVKLMLLRVLYLPLWSSEFSWEFLLHCFQASLLNECQEIPQVKSQC